MDTTQQQFESNLEPIQQIEKPISLPKFVPGNESKRLLLSLAVARGTEGFTEAEAQKVLTWAELAYFQYHTLKLILDGDVVIDVANDNLRNFDDVKLKHIKYILDDSLVAKFKEQLALCDKIAPDEAE